MIPSKPTGDRLREFPDQIRELYLKHVIVQKIMQAYAYGSILTREEALCQMVVCLAKESQSRQEHLVHLYERNTIPPEIVAQEHEAKEGKV